MDTTSSTPIHRFEEPITIPELGPAVEENVEETSGIMDIVNLELRDAADIDHQRDTFLDFSTPHNDHQTPLHKFLAKYDISRLKTVNSRGITLGDGRKLDVLVPENNMIKLEYDVPIRIGGKHMGCTSYNLVFSAISGDCITCDFRDSFDFDTISDEGAKLKLEYCTSKRPDWRAILAEFDTAFAHSN